MKSYCFTVEDIECEGCIAPIKSALEADPANKNVTVDTLSKRVRLEREENENVDVEASFRTAVENVGKTYGMLIDTSLILHNYCFSVENLQNPTDAKKLRDALLENERNVKVYVDLESKRVHVSRDDLNPDSQKITDEFKKNVTSLGYIYSGNINLANIVRQHWWKGLLAIFVGFGILALSAFSFGIPLLAMYIIGAIATVLTIYVGRDTYINAFKALMSKEKTLSMDSLFAISTIAALLVSISGCCLPFLGLPMLFDAALIIFGFRHIGKAIEEKIKEQIMAGLSLHSRLPSKVKVIRNETIQEIALSDVIVDDIVIVPAGTIIPVDGVCVSKKATIFDTIETGEKTPKEIHENVKVLAGMLAQTECQIKASKIAKDSYLVQLDNHIDEARMARHAEIQDKAGKAIRYFIPCIILLAIIATILVSCFLSPIMGLQCGIAVLVAACPCILGFIIPIAIKIGMTKAAEHQAYFNGGQALQAAAEIDTVIFDLNGTLTQGKPVVINDEFTHQDTGHYELVSAIEKFYAEQCKAKEQRQHGFAQLLHKYATQKCSQNENEQNYTIVLDENCRSGLSGTIDGKQFYLGNNDLLRSAKIDFDVFHPIAQRQALNQYIYFVLNGQIKGFFTIQDPLRPEAEDVINKLKKLKTKKGGIEIELCTGTNHEAALAFAAKLGIERVKYNCSAEQKCQYVEQKMIDHKVAMIGDEGNDSSAIARSNVGFALKSHHDMGGFEMACKGAQVIIKNDSLYPILTAMEIANQTMSNIKQNLAVSISYNLVACLIAGGVLLAIGIALNPGIAAALMIFQTLLVLGNVYRFRCQAVSDKAINKTSEFSNEGEYKNSDPNQPLRPPVRKPSEHISDTTLLEQSLAADYTRKAQSKPASRIGEFIHNAADSFKMVLK